MSVSPGAGNTGRSFDLETHRQIAVPKFIRWQGGSEAIRQNGLFIDVFHLASAHTNRRRVMHVTSAAIPRYFLESSSRSFDSYRTVRDFWADAAASIELIALCEVMPWPDLTT